MARFFLAPECWGGAAALTGDEAKHAAQVLRARRGDQITVFEVEAEVIRRHHADLLAEGEPHAEGACAFLDGEGACRIYEHRPYVCRTQGLPLRWLEELDGETVELRDICPLNDEDDPIGTARRRTVSIPADSHRSPSSIRMSASALPSAWTGWWSCFVFRSRFHRCVLRKSPTRPA